MKSHKEQILNKCRHFNGIQSKTCRAGVKYADVKIPGIEVNGMVQRYTIPCFRDQGNGEGCDKCEWFSEAEADKQVEDAGKMFDRTMVARAAIVAYLGGPWKKGMEGSGGVIDCPVCNGKALLHFSRSGYNGHIHAKCESLGCVAWME